MQTDHSANDTTNDYALAQLRRRTKDDTKLYKCVCLLYRQGVPLREIKELIPELIRARELADIRKILEHNNAQLISILSEEMHSILDVREQREEDRYKKLDQLIRQQQVFRKSSSADTPAARLRRFFIPA